MKMKSDGNCQFRALADQLFKTADSHKQVRQDIVKQLKACPDRYKKNVVELGMDYSQYVKIMSKNSEWGDQITLRAAADTYKVKIIVITSLKDPDPIVFLPKSGKPPDRVIHLSYLLGVHYDSIYYLNNNGGSDTPLGELQRKKNKKKSKEKQKEEKKEEEEEEKKNKEKEEVKMTKKREKKRPCESIMWVNKTLFATLVAIRPSESKKEVCDASWFF